MTEVAVNSYELQRARADFLLGMGLDAKRPTAWSQYGYKQELTFADFKLAYDRGGAGHGAVHKLLEKCWQSLPRIKQPAADKETEWEKKVGATLRKVAAWQKLRDFDRRNMVGRYAALIYRVRDGKALRDPLGTASELVDLIPVFEDQIQVTAWIEDKEDENYGQPAMFQIRTRSPNATKDTQAKPEDWLDVHPSRVQILAEGSVGDMFDGVPLLQAGFNSLVDIEKLSGGGAESALKNSARTVVFQYDKESAPQALTTENPDGTVQVKTVRQVHEEQTRGLNRNQDASIVLQGGKAETLQTTVSDLSPQFGIAANLFAASVRIPFTILFGQQTGRLASDEDKADFAARCASRQANELTPMLEQFVRRMQAAGIIDAGEFEIEWPPVDAPSDADKLANLIKAADAMQKAFQAGLTEPLFDANELRAMVGFEPRSNDGMPAEGDPGADPSQDPSTDPTPP
ncbi:anti-CBASS protein Acb1 family protein [Pseudacidovorax intermedius]|uniref:Anti-CBASS protein Acb1-like N-terminal domain-containing protein n=1 Tax=Pseudacidovorax intermedius TaxID=433924 RepID=A0A147GNY2_9BURK|nr:anti-CBASS Acb1 family protein [Pseudacidovorax intermedius]KTT15855.1 hypothetical protein NS331_19550 [Pseudacidovorax intermedius]